MPLTCRQASSPRPCATLGLDSQQTLFERLLLCEAGGRQQCEYAICIGSSPGRQPGARGPQPEFRGVAARGFGRQTFIQASGAAWSPVRMSSSARSTLGGPPRRGVDGQPARAAANAHDDQNRKWSHQSFLSRHTSNSLHVCLRILARWRIIVAANLGRLAVISTPIGNLGDLSPRARDELAAAELVAAEDTRRTGQLLTTLGLVAPAGVAA